MPIWSSEIKDLERLQEYFKNQLPELERELKHLIKTDDANVAFLYSRRCLEVIITNLCECELKRERGTEPLKGIIDKLKKERKIPTHIITSMHGLNDLSTYGTHPKEFDLEQVKPVLNNLTVIIKWYLKYKNIRISEEMKPAFSGILTEPLLKKADTEVISDKKVIPFEITKSKLVTGTVIFALLIVVLVVIFRGVFKKDKLEYFKSEGEISVVVLPFQNMTNDGSKNFWQGMIQDNLINFLSNSQELKVRQTESVIYLLQYNDIANYASITPDIASDISQKLDASVFIHGSINQIDTILRLNAKLIDSETKEVFKSFQVDGTVENILYMTDSLSVIVNNYLVVNILKKNVSPAMHNFLGSTKSPEALKNYVNAQNLFWERRYPEARELLHQAIMTDSNYSAAKILLSVAYGNQGLYKDAKKWSLCAYEDRSRLSRGEKIMTEYVHAIYFSSGEALKYLIEFLSIDDQNPRIYYSIGNSYNAIDQYYKAIPELEKSLKLCDKWGMPPYWIGIYTSLGYAYHKTRQYNKEKKLYKKAEQDFPDNHSLLYRQAILALKEGKSRAADEYIERYKSIQSDNSVSKARILANLASIYSEADIYDKAEEYFRESVSIEPENPSMINNLAYFLIDKDQDITEGLHIIDKALDISPDHYEYLDTKGWGVYKQGKYLEAFEILQKSWDLRIKNARSNHDAFLHLEAAKKAVTGKE